MNARRLRLTVPLWRPVAIGVGSVVLSLIQSSLIDSYLLDLMLYLGAIALIGYLDLLPQIEVYRQHVSQGGLAGNWTVPSLLGAPLAFAVFLGFLVSPFLPLNPSQVCEKFMLASSEKEMKKYTTTNLWPALPTLAKSAASNDSGAIELTEQGPAPVEVGGYLVAYRVVLIENGQHDSIEVVFHLVDRQGDWKIEELYYTAVNRQPLEQWVPLSTNYAQIHGAPDRIVSSSSAATPKDEKKQKSWMDDPKTKQTAMYLLRAIIIKLLTRGRGR